MKKYLCYLGLFLTIACPLYQSIDMTIKNTPGDGVERYGDNPIFRNILGIKIDNSSYIQGLDEWDLHRRTILTPRWMQRLGIPKEVETGRNYENYSWWKTEKYTLVMWLRILIKCIPIALLFFGIEFAPSKKE
jgi:hypothetical protein